MLNTLCIHHYSVPSVIILVTLLLLCPVKVEKNVTSKLSHGVDRAETLQQHTPHQLLFLQYLWVLFELSILNLISDVAVAPFAITSAALKPRVTCRVVIFCGISPSQAGGRLPVLLFCLQLGLAVSVCERRVQAGYRSPFRS